MGSQSQTVRPRGSPPCPSPAALVFNSGNSSSPSQLNQEQLGSGINAPGDLSSAEGGAMQQNPDGTLVPMQETHPSDTYTPETQEDDQSSLENAEKLNEAVQESRDGEEPGETGQSETGCLSGKGAPDNTNK